jgi:hypothetical protein
MFYMCECPIPCGNGCAGFWRCADNKTVILKCDECGMPWLNPTDVMKEASVDPNSPCLPNTSIRIYGPGAGWATRNEIENVGWLSFIGGEGAALGDPA